MRRKSRLNATKKPPASLVQGTIDTLTQGISQQPPHLRQVGQGERQVNGWSSPVSGLSKRRPTQYVGRISSTPVTDFFLETMPITAGERYSVFLYNTGGNARVQILRDGVTCSVDVHGTGLTAVTGAGGAKEVNGTSGSYLYNASGLEGKYVFINNGSFGLLLNREKVTAMDAATTPAQKYEALLFVQGVNYEVTYTVNLNGTNLTGYTTPKATDTVNALSTDTVAAELASRVNAASGFTATRVGSVVYVKRTNDADFTISLSDSRSNTLARSFKGVSSSFSGLPTVAPNGFVMRIDGSPNTTSDDYWVKFVTRDSATFGDGVWQEAPAPGIEYRINSGTMPLVFYRKAPNVFFVGPADGATRSITVGATTHSFTFPMWGERTAGDATSVPAPSFIGKAIKDHGLFRSRYVVVAGESVVLSEVDQIFNFFGDTSSQVLDTDPIDVRAVSETSIDLNWILPIDESLLVFSGKSQFQVRPADADVLTPKTAVCLRLSNIEMNSSLRPKIAGPNVVFATNEYGYTGFREFQFFDTQQRRLGLNLGGSLNITLNAPKYITGLATSWDVGESLDYFVCLAPDNRKKLYVYKYLWQSGQGSLYKQQASWSTWEFDGDIRWARFFDNRLWLVMTYGDGTYTTFVESEELDDTADPQIYLDRLVLYPECNADVEPNNNVASTYNAETNTTTFTLPYQMQGTTDAVIRYDNSRNRALVVGTATSGTQIVCSIRGDWRTDKLAIGRRYKFEYQFTPAYKPSRDQARQRVIGDLNGRLQVATWTVHHNDSGRYDVIVRRQNRSVDSRHQFWARVLNVENNKLDTAATVLDTGSFRVPVHSRNTECSVSIESDSWLPLTISGASWEGNYSDRARSLG